MAGVAETSFRETTQHVAATGVLGAVGFVSWEAAHRCVQEEAIVPGSGDPCRDMVVVSDFE